MQPIKLARVRFADKTVEGPGFTTSSITSCWDPTNGTGKRHRIFYHHWVNGYWIEYYDRDASRDGATLVDAAYVWRSPGDWVVPLDGPIPAPVRAQKPGRG